MELKRAMRSKLYTVPFHNLPAKSKMAAFKHQDLH
jgi:hypothetical protein